MVKSNTSEMIRETAVQVLHQYPEGLRYKELRQKVEDQLKDIIEPDSKSSGKYRGAIWDLEKRVEDVEKVKISHKKVFLKLKGNNKNNFSISELRDDLKDVVIKHEALISSMNKASIKDLSTSEILQIKELLSVVETIKNMNGGDS